MVAVTTGVRQGELLGLRWSDLELLGHSTFTLTMNTYSHVIPSLEREAVDRMNAALTSS